MSVVRQKDVYPEAVRLPERLELRRLVGCHRHQMAFTVDDEGRFTFRQLRLSQVCAQPQGITFDLESDSAVLKPQRELQNIGRNDDSAAEFNELHTPPPRPRNWRVKHPAVILTQGACQSERFGGRPGRAEGH